MANLDCEQAFNQEMAALNGLNDKVEQIVKFVGYDETNPLKTLSLKIDETNRLLKLLCVGILGKDKD